MAKKNISEATRLKNAARAKAFREAHPDYMKKYNKEYRAENREELKLQDRKYHADNRERKNAYRKAWGLAHPGHNTEWARANPDKVKNNWLKMKYDITLEQYNAMIVQQEGKCAICGTTDPKGKGAFHVDHNHDTGAIRGLLCHFCNAGLGHFNDSVDILQKATTYLQKYVII